MVGFNHNETLMPCRRKTVVLEPHSHKILNYLISKYNLKLSKTLELKSQSKQYSEDLKSRHVWISNGHKEVGGMVFKWSSEYQSVNQIVI